MYQIIATDNIFCSRFLIAGFNVVLYIIPYCRWSSGHNPSGLKQQKYVARSSFKERKERNNI